MGFTVHVGLRPRVAVKQYYNSVQGASAVCEWRLSPIYIYIYLYIYIYIYKPLKLYRIGCLCGEF